MANQVKEDIALQIMVGSKIRELRQFKGMHAAELARISQISPSQLSKIENGKATISIKVLNSLCKILNRPLSYLFQSEKETPRILGTLNTVKGPENKGVEWFAKEIIRTTKGGFKLVPMWATKFGSSMDQIEILRQGGIDLFIGDAFAFQRFSPVLKMLSVPYSFSSNDHLRFFLESDYIYQNVMKPLRESGIRIINKKWNWLRGIEMCLVSHKPIIGPDQVKGLRVRISSSGSAAGCFWEELGAKPIVIPWHKVKPALAKREIDLLPTLKSFLYPLGFCKYTKYITLLDDTGANLAVAMSELRYMNLPISMYQNLEDACGRAGDRFSSMVQESEIENEKRNMAEHKATYLKVDVAPWKEVAHRIRARLLKKGELSSEAWEEIKRLNPSVKVKTQDKNNIH